jgi:putative protein-disulfide isomerase
MDKGQDAVDNGFMSRQRLLWYFADPMCSWCWGFAPVIEAIKDSYRQQLKVALILGGLRPGTTEALTPERRAEILHHWHEVHERTGQVFSFEGALPEGFVYDTEPPSRAVVAVSELDPDLTFAYFKSVQAAFYAERQDVTQAETLAALAEQYNLARPAFLERFDSEKVRAKTRQHFEQARRAGVTGFPTTVLQSDDAYAVLSPGYRPFAELSPLIDTWLSEQS